MEEEITRLGKAEGLPEEQRRREWSKQRGPHVGRWGGMESRAHSGHYEGSVRLEQGVCGRRRWQCSGHEVLGKGWDWGSHPFPLFLESPSPRS